MEEERTKELIKIAHEVSKLFHEEMDKLPYGANVIDELHAGENAHSRILRMLLQYSGGGKYPVYSSFINLLKSNCQEIPEDISCYRPEFVNEEGRIDLLIKEYTTKNRFAIIIENKVCGATDQDEQIQRYIDKVEQDNVLSDRIIVIYLTKDGEKEVSDYSLTESAKKKLGVTNDSEGRFIRLNYKHHILPWLQNEVLPNIAIKEDILISSVRLYADYLKGICGERELEKTIYDKITIKMKEVLGLDTVSKCISVYQEVESLQDQMTNLLVDEAKKVMEERFYGPMKDFFENNYPKLAISFADKGNDTRHFWFDIIISKWKKTKICFTYNSSGQYFGVCHIDLNNKVESNVAKVLKERFPYGKTTVWWPWYGMLHTQIPNSDKVEIWNSIYCGELTLYVKLWFAEVVNCTKDLDM